MAIVHIVLVLLQILECGPCVGLGLERSVSSSMAASTMLTAVNTTKPGCPRKCGNVTIPYPFGIEEGCSMTYGYTIACNTTEDNTSQPWLGEVKVLDISETQVRIMLGYVAATCENTHPKEGESFLFNTSDLPYAISHTANKFMVTGCHHYGLLRAKTWTGHEVVSCVSLCTTKEDLRDATCSGIGCCQAAIPKGIWTFNTSMEKIFYEDLKISSGNCSYAFIGEPSSFKFHGAVELQDPGFRLRTDTSLPLVMNWFIANHTCREARANSLITYACQQNTRCIDVKQDLGRKGYRCKCLPGYEGNPYLTPGCKDINECAGSSHFCSGICVNTPGNYTCSCPRGQHGDGKKDGIGCLPDKSLRTIFAVGFGVGLVSLLFILGGFWLIIASRRRKEIIQRTKNFKRNGGLLLQQHLSSMDVTIGKTRIFTTNELEKATDHFNNDRVLGKGGQGTVYKGMLSDGSIVAIKKSNLINQLQLKQFINEVIILSQINHRNIVKLLGCCLETEVPLLVYEYIPNGALSDHIHDPKEEFPITWEMRLQIATDVAGSLTYLHSASSKPVFHRDIKTANILLDDKYKAKVSDFGTSRSIDIDQTHVTTRVQGTFGYLDPEYFQSSQFTEKSDVYSFGVVLVELLTGQKAIRPTESPTGKSLVSWFLSTMENSELEDILAARVANEGQKESVFAVANLAKRCLNMDGKQRPTMKEVALELGVISQHQHLPVPSQKNLQDAIDKRLTDMTKTTDSGIFPSWSSDMEDDFTLN